MNELSILPAGLLFLAAMACLGLGVAIYRRTERSTEMTVLLLMLVSLIGLYLTLGTNSVLYGALRLIDIKTHYVLLVSGDLWRLVFFALLGHFLALSYRRLVCDTEGISRGDWPILQSSPDPRMAYGLLLFFTYGAALFAIAVYTQSFIENLRNFQSWRGASLPEPPSFVTGFFTGFSSTLWLVIQIQILSSIYRHLPEGHKKSRFARWIFEEYASPTKWGLIQLHLSERPPTDSKARGQTDPAAKVYTSPDEWKAFLTLVIGTLVGVILSAYRSEGNLLRQKFELLFNLLLLLVVLPLIYYKTRFIFFDVLIKRGVLAVVLLVSGGFYFIGFLYPLAEVMDTRIARAGSFTVGVGGVVFVLFWTLLSNRMNAMMDRWLFRRPDYPQSILEINTGMRRFTNRHTLVDYVTHRLQTILSAAYVQLVASSISDSLNGTDIPVDPVSNLAAASDEFHERGASVEVETSERHFGCLIFGKRPRGLQYQSEDLNFLMTISSQLAGMLQNLELHEEQEAQARREQALRELAAQAEVKALRAQINPHFLFNALNTLAELVQEDPSAAEATILNLSKVFRFALDSTHREKVPLGEEIEFVQSYLEVERVRFEDKLNYEITVPDELRSVPIPAMLIQPLVENAVRHGISHKLDGGTIRIGASLQEGKIRFDIEDNGVGFRPEVTLRGNHRSIGLSNVRQRLETLYGPGHFAISSTPGVGTTVRLELELEKQFHHE
ncbi:MAG: histidine kinase [Acidobacteriia bacterium]|nr:histidine kinase [Terriglobia bacterium]